MAGFKTRGWKAERFREITMWHEAGVRQHDRAHRLLTRQSVDGCGAARNGGRLSKHCIGYGALRTDCCCFQRHFGAMMHDPDAVAVGWSWALPQCPLRLEQWRRLAIEAREKFCLPSSHDLSKSLLFNSLFYVGTCAGHRDGAIIAVAIAFARMIARSGEWLWRIFCCILSASRTRFMVIVTLTSR